MANLFSFEIHTPHRLFFSGQIEGIIVAISDGEIGVFANRSPFTAPANTGLIRIKDKEGAWKEAFTSEGILEVTEKKAVLLVEAAEWPEEIDYTRALEAKERAEATLASSTFKFETVNAKAKLRRAEYRLKAASRSGRKQD